MTHPGWNVRELFALAYLDGLDRMARGADVRPVDAPSRYVRLDATGRTLAVALSDAERVADA